METFLKQILVEFNVQSNKVVDNTITKLMHNAKINALAKAIHSSKQQVLTIFEMYREKEEFKDSQLVIANAHAKKYYECRLDLAQFPTICIKDIKNLETIGLAFDPIELRIYGIPRLAASVDLQLVFTNSMEENPTEDIKTVSFIINADPKDLWLNKPSNKNDLYAKADSATHAGEFLDKRIVVASQRGRSHAHEGSFRDDDFYVSKLPLDWAIIAVADGAGSAKFARQGSKIATEYCVQSFASDVILGELNDLCLAFYTPITIEEDPHRLDEGPFVAEADGVETDGTTADLSSSGDSPEGRLLKVKSSIINMLYKAVRDVHAHLTTFAQQEGILLKDLHTTLIFTLVKKFEFGYVVLSFGVGDCPINVVLGDLDEVHLLNTLDIGEFGGGTRFITMPEIFSQSDMAARFSINKFDNFSKITLMTDGIYDAKFITENKLESKDAWHVFLNDLAGQNEEGVRVDFEDDKNVEDQLLVWLDFWSKGNHDDRTLAIIY